jgi:hypothetical protein
MDPSVCATAPGAQRLARLAHARGMEPAAIDDIVQETLLEARSARLSPSLETHHAWSKRAHHTGACPGSARLPVRWKTGPDPGTEQEQRVICSSRSISLLDSPAVCRLRQRDQCQWRYPLCRPAGLLVPPAHPAVCAGTPARAQPARWP